MFNTWYFSMLIICYMLRIYTGEWCISNNVEFKRKATAKQRRINVLLFLVPIINTILAFMFIIVFFGTLFFPDILKQAWNDGGSKE